ncbi:hypothetical protein ACSVC9_12160 [Clostridium sp. LBM24168]
MQKFKEGRCIMPNLNEILYHLNWAKMIVEQIRMYKCNSSIKIVQTLGWKLL